MDSSVEIVSTQLIIKVRKIRNPYNQVQQLTQDTNQKVTTSQLDFIPDIDS